MYRITTFGGVEVRDEDGELQTFRSRKHVALLVYLRSNPRRVHLREPIARLFWETESSLARHSLSQALYDLRSTLGQVIRNVPGDAIRVEADRLEYDVADLDRAMDEGDLRTAVELYSAPFAPDLDRVGTDAFERWLERERSRLSMLGQTALRQFLTYADNRGEWGEMCSAALRLIRLNPLDEEAHRALMRGLWLHGDQTSALEHFQEVRERLEGELPQGLSEKTLELVERIEGSRPRVVKDEPTTGRQIPLVGRQQELEFLARFAEERTSRPECLVIRGEAGIGKTRLAEELEKLLTLEGHEILKSQCYAAESEVAYGPVLDGLREITEQIDDLPGNATYLELSRLFPSAGRARGRPSQDVPADGQSARRRLFEEIADMLRRYCRDRSVVWIVEDIHCIDGASSALLHYLARRLADEPFRLVFTTRPDNEQNEAAQGLLAEDFFVDNARTCEVGPLSLEAIEKLLEEVMATDAPDETVTENIANLSGGNPFYAVELLRVDADLNEEFDVSDLFRGRLKSVLKTRLTGLASNEVRILEAMAVLGPLVLPRHLTEMTGFQWTEVSDICDRLMARSIVSETEKFLSFTHDLMREFIYNNIGVVSRSALHLQAAELLANSGESSPSAIARHFRLGGDDFRAFEYAIRAAKVAQAKAAFSEAADMASLAGEVAAREEHRVKALEAYVDATEALGMLEEAKCALKGLVTIVEDTEDAEEWLKYNFRLIEVLKDATDWDEAEKCIMEVHRLLQETPNVAKRATHQLRLDSLHLSVAVRAKADSTVDSIASRVQSTLETSTGDLPFWLVGEANYSLAGYAAFYRSAEKAQDYLSTITEGGRSLSSELKIRSHQFLGGVYTKLGAWDEALYNLKTALELTKSKHDVVDESAAWNNLGCMYLETGDWDDAEHCFRRAIDLQDAPGSELATRLHSDVNLANALFYRGEPRKAKVAYKECLDFLNRRGLQSFKPEVNACIGLTALQCGDVHSVQQSAEYLGVISENDLRGIQERYKIDWFLNYLSRAIGLEVSCRSLQNVANEVNSTDPISSLKLQWLSNLMRGSDDESTVQALREKGLYWFIGFSRRWMRSANSNIERNLATRITRSPA